MWRRIWIAIVAKESEVDMDGTSYSQTQIDELKSDVARLRECIIRLTDIVQPQQTINEALHARIILLDGRIKSLERQH